METEFLEYFQNWKIPVDTRPGTFSAQQKPANAAQYTDIAWFANNLQINCSHCAHCLGPEAPTVLTSHLNQDPLEQLLDIVALMTTLQSPSPAM